MHPKHISNKEARKSVRCLIDKERAQHGKRRHGSDGRLKKAAARHTKTMTRRGCFSHQCPGEGSLETRLRSVGYLEGGLSRWAYGEVIAAGSDHSGTPGQTVQRWMNSPPHRSAILSGNYRELGIAFDNRGDKGFYTVDFGMRVK